MTSQIGRNRSASNIDHDGDGYSRLDDCDDSDASVHPGAPFTCVWSQVPVCTKGQDEAFTETAMAPPAANSNTYVVPDAVVRDNLSSSISEALEGNVDESTRHATLANYTLCAEGSILIWSPLAVVVLVCGSHPVRTSLSKCHLFLRMGTLEGLFLFQQAMPRTVFRDHRCASDVSSPCSGETMVCTLFSSEPFRISDMAHTDTSLFHSAHIALADGLPNTTILQLHMFLDPGASVSNGKRRDTTADQPSARLAAALTEAFPNELITSCNDYGAGNEADRTCGTSNTQGRH